MRREGKEIILNDKKLSHLIFLYGEKSGIEAHQRLNRLLDKYRPLLQREGAWALDQRDAILITYADQVQEANSPTLQTLSRFLMKYAPSNISTVHILPFYPWSSDDGFSVKDYRAVEPGFGSWDDLEYLGRRFQLMFDAVINHTSAESEWFGKFLRDDPEYQDFYITVQGDPDLSKVVRPRALPLITKFKTGSGEKSVWTTFSPDQVDLNYQNPDVLLEILDILLFYVTKHANLIRLDAVAYLWKEIGTSCIHQPKTYRIVQLIRSVLRELAPDVMLITETNVRHQDNVSYFGDGRNMAHLVYNFTLPPLLLHTFHTASSANLNQWLANLETPTEKVTYLNFLASHDGIGINPLNEILSDNQIDDLVSRTKSVGGLVSYKSVDTGAERPYELNINYLDALRDPNAEEPAELEINRFVTAHAIMFSLRGIPGIYFHSLFGSRGWPEGVQISGRNRTINRQKLHLQELEADLGRSDSRRARIHHEITTLLAARSSSPAFHPFAEQRVIEFQSTIFAILRFSHDHSEKVLCVHNITSQYQSITLKLNEFLDAKSGYVIDLISNQAFKADIALTLVISPYQSIWLTR